MGFDFDHGKEENEEEGHQASRSRLGERRLSSTRPEAKIHSSERVSTPRGTPLLDLIHNLEDSYEHTVEPSASNGWFILWYRIRLVV